MYLLLFVLIKTNGSILTCWLNPGMNSGVSSIAVHWLRAMKRRMCRSLFICRRPSNGFGWLVASDKWNSHRRRCRHAGAGPAPGLTALPRRVFFSWQVAIVPHCYCHSNLASAQILRRMHTRSVILLLILLI